MKIVTTFEEIRDVGVWLEYCEETGCDEWCIAEGLADQDTTVTLDYDLAVKIGLIVDGQ